MYSTLYGGIVKDPSLMIVPIDDHMVHRGDGVFEAIRFHGSKIYLLDEHLARLVRSADSIAMKLPLKLSEIKEICEGLRVASGVTDGLLRLFVARGPGDFSPNPYATIGSQFYAVVTAFKPMSAEMYTAGARLMISDVPVKPSFYSQVKSCNYLQNVMMKKQTVDRGYDFCVNFNEDGYLAEGPTENIALVDAQGVLCAPKFDYTLKGTTMVRAFDLARGAGLASVEIRDIGLSDLRTAREIMMIGTTLGVLPITSVEGAPVGAGQVGSVARGLGELLAKDMN
jgi:branched-chain amino acid aminotransferase